MSKPLVLVTGSSGRIGRAVVSELSRRGHPVRGFDRVATPGLSDARVGDITDRVAVDSAMEGVGCLIHLAATPDDADFLTELLPNNLTALYHVMESARLAGVRRIVLASSGQVNWWQQHEGPHPVRVGHPISPRSWYAATKMFLESIGYSFTVAHGISVIVARLGWCPRTPAQADEIEGADWARDVYFSPGDAGRFFACCVEASPTLRHALVNASSRPFHTCRIDLTEARELLGFEPQETWPDGIDIVRGTAPAA